MLLHLSVLNKSLLGKILRHAKTILFLIMVVIANNQVNAATITVNAGDDLQSVISKAATGSTIFLNSGQYLGNLIIDKPLTITGPKDHSAQIIGARKGRTLWVKASNTTVSNLSISNSGLSLPDMDAGVFLDKAVDNVLIKNNRILDNSVGVYVWGATNALVVGNVIVGNKKLRVNERGNGVTVWNAPGSKIINNDISAGRDGIFSNNSRENIFSDNRFHDLRYAVHYMYTNDSEVSNNYSSDNQIAYAIMFSRRLKVIGNIGVNSSHQGVMLNATDDSIIDDNVVINAEKCVFIYNSNMNELSNNYFQNCDIGVHYTGSEGNQLYNNAFVNNQNQVKYVGTRLKEWSHNGRGNYWSDMTAFDLNGDGIGDTAYRPNGIIDQVIWRAPNARLLLNSPAVSIVKWAQNQFPAILPGGVIDSAPLMAVPNSKTLDKYNQMSRP